MSNLLNELQAVGFNPLVIDEHTNFGELSPKEILANKELIKPKTNGKRNKQAGHSWERELVAKLNLLGFNVGTTRNLSRARDAQKVDIMGVDERKDGFLPFNIQAKTETRVPKFQQILAEMPVEKNAINMIAFRQTSRATAKFMKQGEYAIMNLKDWFYYIEIEKKYKELLDQYEILVGELDEIRQFDDNEDEDEDES